jgi:hypothetical protein
MNNHLNISMVENGWTVTERDPGGMCYGKMWVFQTVDQLCAGIKTLLEPAQEKAVLASLGGVAKF